MKASPFFLFRGDIIITLIVTIITLLKLLPRIAPSDVAILDNRVILLCFPFPLLVVTRLGMTCGYRQWGGDTVLRGGWNLCGFTDAVRVS